MRSGTIEEVMKDAEDSAGYTEIDGDRYTLFKHDNN